LGTLRQAQCIAGDWGLGQNGLGKSNNYFGINTMKRAFRKYHRTLSIIICVPLLLTVLTGMLTTIVREWPISTGLSSNLLLKIHTGEIVHLEAIYPILNGLGLIGLLVTGLSMSGLFDRKKRTNINH